MVLNVSRYETNLKSVGNLEVYNFSKATFFFFLALSFYTQPTKITCEQLISLVKHDNRLHSVSCDSTFTSLIFVQNPLSACTR